ncbi:MAG: SDR family NAD(P)-dependent oxidoreductase [Deltaproteobacteria bacterium]|nr:SDR family NAD(P)-dependent oxidoreductase [Deltaproteobacteria bacterium]
MDTTFTDRIILITGATSGIGAACAEAFAVINAKLILIGRRQHRLEELQNKLGGEKRVLTITLDISDTAATKNALKNLPNPFAQVDVLVNNAGLALGFEPAQEASLDDWHTMININWCGLVTCTHCILPGMVARNCGHIINIGSIAGLYPYPNGNVYSAYLLARAAAFILP